jgi:hypothetical protein
MQEDAAKRLNDMMDRKKKDDEDDDGQGSGVLVSV